MTLVRPGPYRGAAGLAVACGLLTAVGGCRPSGPERVAVSGTVTYQGKPVPGGTIYFVPCQGTAGLPGYAAITDSQYYVKTDGGLLVGDFLVKIEAYRDRAALCSRPPTEGLVCKSDAGNNTFPQNTIRRRN